MMKRALQALLILLLMFCSCIGEYDGNPRSKGNEPKLVLNSLFNPKDAWKVEIVKTRAILQNPTFEVIENAAVDVKDSKGNTINLKFSDGYYIINTKPEIGETYSITASLEGAGVLMASSSVPDQIQIQSIAVKDSIKFSFVDSVYYSQLDLVFADPVYHGNSYELFLYKTDEKGIKTKICIYSNDISVENSSSNAAGEKNCGDNILFTDKNFNGQTYKITSYFKSDFKSDKIYIYLRSCAPPAYDYLKSYYFYIMSLQNPFTDPSGVYSNVENGVGIFGGYTYDVDTLMY